MKFYQVRAICRKSIFSRKKIHDSTLIFKDYIKAQNYSSKYKSGLLRDGVISRLKEIKKIVYVELYLDD